MKRIACSLLFVFTFALTPIQSGEKNNLPPSGFTTLFDGKSLDAWRDADKLSYWKIGDGTVHYTGEKGAKHLITKKDYKDFELYCDWKITKKGDSGIYLRGLPQVQIWDSIGLEGGLKEDADKGSGGLWNNKKGAPGKQPLVMADNPVGEWNTFHIRMVGENVTIKLNGKLVVDHAPLQNYKGGAVPATGPIELQTHGTPIWFRNIYVKEILSDTK